MGYIRVVHSLRQDWSETLVRDITERSASRSWWDTSGGPVLSREHAHRIVYESGATATLQLLVPVPGRRAGKPRGPG